MADNLMTKAIDQGDLDTESRTSLEAKFRPFYDKAEEWRVTVQTIKVTSADQIREMQLARAARLALRDLRKDCERLKAHLKEDSIKRGRVIDQVWNTIRDLIQPMESYLEDQEKFAERQEEARLNARYDARVKELAPYMSLPEMAAHPIKKLDDQAFADFLAITKRAHEAKLEAAAKIEAERIAKAKAEAEERERLRQENERLRQQRAQQEKELAKAKADAEKKRKAAEAEKLKLQREIDAKNKAEQDRIAAEKETERKRQADIRKLARRPDTEKLAQLSKDLANFRMPDVKTDEAREVLRAVMTSICKLTDFIDKKVEELQ